MRSHKGEVRSEGGGDRKNAQRSAVRIAKLIREFEEEGLPPDSVRGEGALVKVRRTVHLTLGAVDLPPSQALFA